MAFHSVTILSDDTILSQTSVAFRNAYAFLLVVSLVGMVLIFLGMRVTYWPLHKLTLKLLPASDKHGNYVEQLDAAFSNVRSENQQLQQKIDSYRLSMQKSLLDSIVEDNVVFDTNNPLSLTICFVWKRAATFLCCGSRHQVRKKAFR